MHSAPATARARARAELTNEIKATARRHLAEVGAPALSLRAVARELGMASSAVYRYFASRDELLTALIVDAFDAVGAAAEEAAGAGLTRFSLLVTATVTDPALLPHVADLVDQAGGASRLKLRRVYAGQSAAFAAALGIGLVLHRHVQVPAAVRQFL